MTYKRKGRDVCNAKQIPEDILRSITCEVLGIEEMDDDVFNARIDSITAGTDEKNNILIFHMTDGEVIVKRWMNPSRSRSWTPEMKEAAREAGKKGGLRNEHKKKERVQCHDRRRAGGKDRPHRDKVGQQIREEYGGQPCYRQET